MTTTKICTWNVNGIRSRKNLGEVFKEFEADIYCIQETKISKDQINESLAFVNNDYFSCFAIPRQLGFRGRSGCATYYRDSARPFHVEYGIFDDQTCSDSWKTVVKSEKVAKLHEIEPLDSEGRVLITCHNVEVSSEQQTSSKKLYLFNVYFPRLDPEKEERVDFKDKFNKLIEQKAKHYLDDPDAYVMIACDLNIQHKQIDSCEEEKNFDDCIYRKWLTHFLEPKDSNSERYMVDSFRLFYPEKKYAYTCWPTLIIGARENNLGARIDLLFIDSELVKFAKDVKHLTRVPGSDHCPVMIELENVSFVASKDQPYGCTRTWPEFRKRQTNLKDFFTVKQRSPPKKEENSSPKNDRIVDSDLYILPQSQKDTQNQKPNLPNASLSQPGKQLSGYERIMQKKPSKPKPRHCPKHGLICIPKTNEKKNTSQYMRSYVRCPDPACKFFRWGPKVI